MRIQKGKIIILKILTIKNIPAPNNPNAKAVKLQDEDEAEALLHSIEDEKKPINDFIEEKRKIWKEEFNSSDCIVFDLIKSWYSWEDIMDSSLSDETKTRMENYKTNTINTEFSNQNFRFNNKEELEYKFFEIIQDMLTSNKHISEIIKDKFPLKRVITIDEIRRKEEDWRTKHKDFILNIDLSWEILPDLDWSKSRNVFDYLSFDDKTFSNTLSEHLPKWYNPKEVFEKGKKTPRIDKIHEMWYTWKWVSVAICDWQLKPHEDINTKNYVLESHALEVDDYFHASAVSSILAWNQTGIAPESNLYFFAEYQDKLKDDWWDDLKVALNQILTKNESLPDNEKIRVVSISGSLYWEGIKDYVKALNESWVRVLSSEEFFKNFCYLQKIDPMWDVNDLTNYKIPRMFIEQMKWHTKEDIEKQIFIPSWGMTVAAPETESSYRYDYQASASWSIPVLAWYYALACQANPGITPVDFINIAKEEAEKIKLSDMYRNEEEQRSLKEKGIDVDIEIKVLNIENIIQRIIK